MVTKTKTAQLTSSLVSKKGAATPAINSANTESNTNNQGKVPLNYHKALTLKLDKDRYVALKNAGTELDKTSQDILVEALDLWLNQHPTMG